MQRQPCVMCVTPLGVAFYCNSRRAFFKCCRNRRVVVMTYELFISYSKRWRNESGGGSYDERMQVSVAVTGFYRALEWTHTSITHFGRLEITQVVSLWRLWLSSLVVWPPSLSFFLSLHSSPFLHLLSSLYPSWVVLRHETFFYLEFSNKRFSPFLFVKVFVPPL